MAKNRQARNHLRNAAKSTAQLPDDTGTDQFAPDGRRATASDIASDASLKAGQTGRASTSQADRATAAMQDARLPAEIRDHLDDDVPDDIPEVPPAPPHGRPDEIRERLDGSRERPAQPADRSARPADRPAEPRDRRISMKDKQRNQPRH